MLKSSKKLLSSVVIRGHCYVSIVENSSGELVVLTLAAAVVGDKVFSYSESKVCTMTA